MPKSETDNIPATRVEKSDEEWRRQLTPDQYDVTRRHATERPFSHTYNDEKAEGTYACVCCGEALFGSDAKFDSGSGWPSFYEPCATGAVSEHRDRSLFMVRTEVRCARCDAHLGHVFPDGPAPTGQRYCMNGTALHLKTDED